MFWVETFVKIKKRRGGEGGGVGGERHQNDFNDDINFKAFNRFHTLLWYFSMFTLNKKMSAAHSKIFSFELPGQYINQTL